MLKLKIINKPKMIKMKCNIEFPDVILANLQEKTVIPTTEQQIVTPDKNYDGLSKVTVNAITLQDKTITPTVEEQIVFSDDNYNGLNAVTINAVTNEIDENIKSENIKKGVDILGVMGNYVGSKYAPRHISFYNYSGTELDYEIANLDTSNITSMYAMFSNCGSLQTLDLSNFDTSKVTDMNTMFQNCYKLLDLNLSNFDTSKVTSMNYMFYYCQSLTTLDLTNFDTSNVTNMKNMFYGCNKLTTIPQLNTSNVTSMNSIFYNCNSLTTIPQLNTSKVTDMNYMFYNCRSLTTIPQLDTSKVTNINSMFTNCNSLTTLGGLLNLGQAYSTTASANHSLYKLNLSSSTLLTEQSLINILNNLYDIKTKGCKPQQVILGRTNLAKLTSTEGQQALTNAQAKGWTVS